MAFSDKAEKYGKGIAWPEKNCAVTHHGFEGLDFNTDKDGTWFEGTAQMVVAYKILKEETEADKYLSELRRAQTEAQNNNSKGIVAACYDGVTTGLDWKYFSRLHIGATAWYICAKRGCNPLEIEVPEQPCTFPGVHSPRFDSTKFPDVTLIANRCEFTDADILTLNADITKGTQKIEIFFWVEIPTLAKFFLFFKWGKLTVDTKETSLGRGIITTDIKGLPIFGFLSPLGIPEIPVKGLPKGEYKIVLQFKDAKTSTAWQKCSAGL